MTIRKEILDELIKNYKNPEARFGSEIQVGKQLHRNMR